MANDTRDIDLVNRLLTTGESEWLEFKHNNQDPKRIGNLCSALSNGARLVGRDKGYVIWGVEDKSRRIVGTEFDPDTRNPGNEILRNWLEQMLSPSPSFEFRKISHPEGELVLLEISAASQLPTAFQDISYIRSGSSVKELHRLPALQKRLFACLDELNWERVVAKEHLEQDRVLDLLDCDKFFGYMGESKPTTPEAVCERLESEALVVRNDAGKWDIANLGAILFARRLSDFGSSIARKGIRAVIYRGNDKASAVRDKVDGTRGYALDLDYVLERIRAYIPVREEIGDLRRRDIPDYPQLAIRELLVNALIHQDFAISGAGPNVFLFGNRLQIDNPGESLVAPDRMVDSPPRSRNEALSALMRRMHLCEEAGSGLIKVVSEVESVQSPPPDFRVDLDATQVTLYGPREFGEMTVTERLRACYQHAVIMYSRGRKMTNPTLRARFGLPSNNRSQVSHVIKDALGKGMIKASDPDHPRTGYIPHWA